METKNTLLGFFKDSGTSAMIVGRIDRLIDSLGGVDKFIAATTGQIEAAYNKEHPESKWGLGKATLDAVDLLRSRAKNAAYCARKAEDEKKNNENEVKVAAACALRREFLSVKMNLKVLADVVAGVSTMLEDCDLSMILGLYRRKLGDESVFVMV